MKLSEEAISDFDKRVFELHNQIRTNPTNFIYELEQIIKQFQAPDSLYMKREGRPTLQTQEGVKAVHEAIQALRNQTPLQPFKWADGIKSACQDHVNDIGPKGLVCHNSSDETSKTSKHRMRKYGNLIKCYGENMAFGCATPVEVLAQLLIDDGNMKRGHRSNILSPDFNYIGCYSGNHNGLDHITVINYAGGFIGAGDDDIIEKQMNEFLQEEVLFTDMPPNFSSWRQNSKIKVEGNIATKTTTRTFKLKDGSEKELKVTTEKKLNLV